MKNFIARTVTLLLLGTIAQLASAQTVSTQPAATQPAKKIQASYDVIGFGMTLAKINETWSLTDDNYQIESVTKAVGLLASFKPETVRIKSQGKFTAHGLAPITYSITREIDTDKNASAKFNWDMAVLTHNDYKGINDLPLSKGTQDRLSVLYHVPLLVKTDQTSFKFGITDGNNLEDYSFTLSPEEHTTEVPLGDFKTRYIANIPAGEQVKYEIWMAIEHNYFPYKIIVTDSKGGKLTQVLTDLSITP